MRIFLDDGHRSEVEQKGHGLQRATLLALLRLLAKQGARYRQRPAPIFLVGELETFLHPYAQKQLAEALRTLVDRYQIVSTTHSPFIISPENIEGYRRVHKGVTGTKNIMPAWAGIDRAAIKRHLEWRGNLEGLFADRIVLVEGKDDQDFYENLVRVFGIAHLPRKFTMFVKTHGKKQFRVVRQFYLRMGFDDVSIVADLDYLFCMDLKHLVDELGLDNAVVERLRKHIGWLKPGDPSLPEILDAIQKNGPGPADALATELAKHRVFILRHGAPESYVQGNGRKRSLADVVSEGDLKEVPYLRSLLTQLIVGATPPEPASNESASSN